LSIREPAVKSAEFVSGSLSNIMLRGCRCHIIVLNVHAPTEDTTDDVKDSFKEELVSVFDSFVTRCQSRHERHF
jgi:hypothetical protein